jgi:hypothetical protein
VSDPGLVVTTVETAVVVTAVVAVVDDTVEVVDAIDVGVVCIVVDGMVVDAVDVDVVIDEEQDANTIDITMRQVRTIQKAPFFICSSLLFLFLSEYF